MSKHKVNLRFVVVDSLNQMGQFLEPPNPEATDKTPKRAFEPIVSLKLVADNKSKDAPTEDIQDAAWRAFPKGEITLSECRAAAFGIAHFEPGTSVLVTIEVLEKPSEGRELH